MVPTNLYDDLPTMKGKRLPICHSAMIPWTAKFVSEVANEALNVVNDVGKTQPILAWDVDRVMIVARENAKKIYGI